MNRFLRSTGISLIAGAAAIAGYSWLPSAPRTLAQSALTSTTTTAALTPTSARIALTSDSGVSAGSRLLVDAELLEAVSEVGTTGTWNVRRGLADGGTPASRHASGARVWILNSGGAGEQYFTYDIMSGQACSTADLRYVPRISTKSGQVADCEMSVWMVRDADKITVRDFTRRDSFEQGYAVLLEDGTAKALTDTAENLVWGSPLGIIQYREEQAKTASSWIAINGQLDISGDGTAGEGVEIVFAGTGDAALQQVVEVGTNGACVAAMITVSAVTAIDELHIGWRQNEAFQDAVGYAAYGDWATIGLVDNAGDLDAQDEEAGGGTQNDDTGVTWGAGERRALKVCLSAAGAPSFYYTDASPDADYPVWIQATTSNTGDPLTSGDGMVPFLAYLTAAAGTITVQWVEITRLP